ncbi:MAG TPA: hypothetical protein VFO89_15540 [Thermoanaerobaculia bacterium]|nr:hypothetical protein [Thermoanaerobaculia bacterium]
MTRAVVRALLALACAVTLSAAAAEPLFPTPLHLTRQVHDPIAGTTVVLEEYGYGNRLVSVRGHKTSIADYERGELTEIDRETSTYSVTRFDVIARALQAAGGGMTAAPQARSAKARELRSAGMKTARHGRNAEVFEGEIESGDLQQKLVIAVDREAAVSREALEVLLGAAYPGTRLPEHDAVLGAAAPKSRGVTSHASDSQSYALPVEQSMTIDVGGQSIELRTTVVRVGNEPPPADLVAIPAGARLVPSRIVAVQDELEFLQRPASQAPNVP